MDFDKEIDAILRNARRDGPVLVGDVVAPHLDADVISAFAENALPERSRGLYMAHLADCDRCRKILSNQLSFNAEEAPIAAAAAAAGPSVITIAERAVPWYRKLFMFPNLAYVMGGLVLVFGGFLGFTVVQNFQPGDAVVSQVANQEPQRSGPSFPTDEASSSSNPAANAMANTAVSELPIAAANSNMPAATPRPAEPGVAGPRVGENNLALDGVETRAGSPPPPPPVALQAAPEEKDRDTRAKEVAGARTSVQDLAKNDAQLKQQQNLPTQSGPMGNNDSRYRAQLENMERRAQAKKATRVEEESSGTRSVGGRTFERKQGVWYDVGYQGRPTINVKRGSAEFNRLDGGLRSIANNLSGTIVVVWGSKAYRID